MYLVICDKKIILKERNLYTGVYFDAYQQFIERYNLNYLNAEEIEKILIFSPVFECKDNKAMVARCRDVVLRDSGITFYLEDLKEIDTTCSSVKTNLYKYASKNNDLSDRGTSHFAYLINDEKTYSSLTGKHQDMLEKIQSLKTKNEWDKIISLFGDLNNISKTEYWDNFEILNNLSFVLSMKASQNKDKTKPYNRFDDYFGVVTERALELEPENKSLLSSKAYYFYQKYLIFKKKCDFDEAYKIYSNLVKDANDKYKEQYRFTHLSHEFLNNQAKNNFKDIFIEYIKIKNSYEKLINDYAALPENQKSKHNVLYQKSLYSYCSIDIDVFLDYRKAYCDKQIFAKDYYAAMLSDKKEEYINKISNYLDILIKEGCFDKATIDNIETNPGYFHVQYRLAELKQIQGIKSVILGSPNFNHFKESNDIISRAFEVAFQYKQNEYAKFNYPNYMKTIKAFNHYFLNEFDKSITVFGNKMKNYEFYELAVLYYLEKDYTSAIKTLERIPSSDTCYYKACKFMKALNPNHPMTKYYQQY